ncbi:hypothetical protein Hamer_G012681, partial [Homarus americanus]
MCPLSAALFLYCLLVAAPLGPGGGIVMIAAGETSMFGLHTEESPRRRQMWMQKEFEFPETTIKDEQYGVALDKMHLELEETPVPWRWTHACVVFGQDPAVYLNGKTTQGELMGPGLSLNM